MSYKGYLNILKIVCTGLFKFKSFLRYYSFLTQNTLQSIETKYDEKIIGNISPESQWQTYPGEESALSSQTPWWPQGLWLHRVKWQNIPVHSCVHLQWLSLRAVVTQVPLLMQGLYSHPLTGSLCEMFIELLKNITSVERKIR